MIAQRAYDVIVIGAGPAGLSAARTAARLGFKTVVLERLAAPGELAHPCSAIIAPVPHQAGHAGGDLYFRKIDLAIPAGLIKGYLRQQRWLSPSGFAVDSALGGQADIPAVAIDKAGLLRLMAEQASAAGAELRFDTEVSWLLREGSRVAGVRTARGEIRGEVVISAEGVNRALCSTVLPFSRVTGPEHFGLIIQQDFEAPAVSAGDVGELITLGRRYTSARSAFGMLVAPAPGRLSAYFCLFAEGPHHYTERSARFYMQEYLSEDPRVQDLRAGAKLISQSIGRVTSGSSPARVTADGFLGLGDAITPAGYLGILPAIYLGRQAALAAVAAVDNGDTSAVCLAGYEQIFTRRMLPELKAEYRTLVNLSNMADDDLDAFCQALGTHRLSLPFSAHARAVEWQTVGSRALPEAMLQVRRILATAAPKPAAVLPLQIEALAAPRA